MTTDDKDKGRFTEADIPRLYAEVRAFEADWERLLDEVRDLKTRQSAAEMALALVNKRLDGVDRRVERLEKLVLALQTGESAARQAEGDGP